MTVVQRLRPRSFRFNSLNSKLLAVFLVMGVMPMTIIGVYANQKSTSDLTQLSGSRMADSATETGDKIDRNLFERYGDVQAFAANPHATGTPEQQQTLLDFLTANYGVYDLMLIVGPDGRIQAANSVDGQGGRVASAALEGVDVSNEQWFTTVAGGGTPSGGTLYTEPARSELVAGVYGDERITLPFTAPIRDNAGELVAVWHNEASFDRIVGDIFAEAEAHFESIGLPNTTIELVRSDGVVLVGGNPTDAFELNLVEEGVEAARIAAGNPGAYGQSVEADFETGVSEVIGYAGTDGALGFEGYGWGVLASGLTSDAAAGAAEARNAMLVLGAVLVAAVVVVGLFLARGISRPLRVNADKLKDVAKGNLAIEFEVRSADEVGRTAAALNSALSSISTTLDEVDQGAAELASASTGLTRLSNEMATNARETAGQATEVVAASEEISASSTAVATAMEQMGASVREIAENTAEAARMTFSAVEASGLARSRMEKLDASATDIGNVISVITSIAEQTNLLALNATIEAARVGEAGKGFAVVANEVKALAQQTATATEEIQAKIETIQSDAAGAVDAIAEISGLIDKVNEIATAIAGAVEEQSATTAEVSHSIHAVTVGTANIASSIGSVAEAADNTRDGAGHAEHAAAELDQLASRLKALLARFQLKAQSVSADASSDSTPWSGETAVPGQRPVTSAPMAAPPTVKIEEFDSLVPSGWD